jgi:excisionase family DNA binding protein
MEYISVTEAADKIGKTRSWIHQLIQANRIPGCKVIGKRSKGRNGRTWLVPTNFKVLPLQR